MLYTLDTNAVSQLLNGNRNVLGHLQNALADGDEVVLNAICYYEIRRGLVLPRFQKKLAAFDRFIDAYGVLSLDELALDEAVTIYQDLRSKGTLIEDADLLIGAIAIANGATLITNNTKHFQRIQGILLEDWQSI